MTFAFDEQPPEDPQALREWLTRLATAIAIDSNEPNLYGGGSNNNPHLYMRWAGVWVAGYYKKGDVVLDNGFTMICINDTFDRAAPQPDGVATWALPDVPGWSVELDVANNIKSGHIYDLSVSGWAQQARAWAPTISPTIDYRIKFTNAQGQKIITIPELDADEWTPVSFTERYGNVGSTFTAELETIDSAGSTNYVEIAGNWPGANPAWATIEGALAFDDVPQGGVITNAYGIDILFQPALSSPDWEIVSV